MKLLAFDTSTDVMSIAVSRVLDGRAQVWEHTGAGGAKASLTLISTVLELLGQAGLTLRELDAICFGSGPGSFTGLRTACAVAQGLAFGAERLVLPVNSLLAVAEEARHRYFATDTDVQVTALLDARMDEMYTASFAWDGSAWTQTSTSMLVKPEALQVSAADVRLAGNVFAEYGARLPYMPASANTSEQTSSSTLPASPPDAGRFEALPTAAAMLRLAPNMLISGAAVRPDDALPVYIRDNVAQTTVEREAIKAAKATKMTQAALQSPTPS